MTPPNFSNQDSDPFQQQGALFSRAFERGEKATNPSGRYQPLAERMRPQRLDEVLGHDEILGPGTPLREALKSGTLFSLLLWGPPGCGKTTLARLLAHEVQGEFVSLSALSTGAKDLREWGQKLSKLDGLKVVFIDEIHRFNKSQQDALLPFVESGAFVLVGATTENPCFELNPALLSRMHVFRLKGLDGGDLRALLEKALLHPSQGLRQPRLMSLPDEWKERLIRLADGDGRRLLNLLEVLASAVSQKSSDVVFDEGLWERIFGPQALPRVRFEARGEEHYNAISALIKSMRGQDVDGAVYYLARLLEGGEDPLFIARRLCIFAAEDVGNGDPRALPLALSVFQGLERVGMPEGRILLSHGVCFLSLCRKSRACYDAIEQALDVVRETGSLEIPMGLLNAPHPKMKEWGYGGGGVGLPQALEGRVFYHRREKDS